MKLNYLVNQLAFLLKVWGSMEDPDIIVELPDGSRLPVKTIVGEANGKEPLVFVLKTTGEA